MKMRFYKAIEKGAFVVFHAARAVILLVTKQIENIERNQRRSSDIEKFVTLMQRKAKVAGARKSNEQRMA